jgi:PAS domain S-box-containing protein
MQRVPRPTSGVTLATALPGTPAPEGRDPRQRIPGTDARTDRDTVQLRRYARGWAPAVIVLIGLEIVMRPVSGIAGMAAIVAFTAAAGAATLFALDAVSGPRNRLVSFVAVATIDVGAIGIALVSGAGNDTAIMMPFLGALLLVVLLDGTELSLGFVVQWIVGMTGSTIAYAIGPLRSSPGHDPLAVSLAASGTLTFVGYTLLWWVRERLTRALDGARMAEAEARSSARAMAALVRSSPVPTIGLDLSGMIQSWNPAAETAFGWTIADTRGGGPGLVAAGSGDDPPAALVARVLAGEAVDGLRAHWQTRDGRSVLVELHAALLVDADGTPGGVVLQAIDETERETLRARVVEVQRLEAVGRLAGGVAHDFNNLLTAVSGYAQLLQDGMPAGDPARADALEIERAAARGAELVRQLLTFGRRQEVRSVVLDLNGLVEGLESMLTRLIGTQARIAIDLDPAIPPVEADPGQLEQVIVNLVVNARDATAGGGEITISTATATGADGRPIARLSVSDTGSGMDQATQARVFEPFFTTKGPGRGTGLGLATVYGIVTAHGGTVTLRSTPGRGTTFHVDLPAAADQGETSPPVRALPTPTVAHPSAAGTVLVVDDEDAVRRLVVRALTASGYHVLEAGDLWSALRVADEHGPIDLILSDVVMPDCRGPELVRRVSASQPGSRVLYMTGYAAEGLGGPDGSDIDGPVLGKPFTMEELAHGVREALERRRPAA